MDLTVGPSNQNSRGLGHWVLDASGRRGSSRPTHTSGRTSTRSQSQAPIGAFEAHVSYDVKPRLWVSLRANSYPVLAEIHAATQANSHPNFGSGEYGYGFWVEHGHFGECRRNRRLGRQTGAKRASLSSVRVHPSERAYQIGFPITSLCVSKAILRESCRVAKSSKNPLRLDYHIVTDSL